jgi:asparagine N-glycosylation enzyme membrane subunit Stt3
MIDAQTDRISKALVVAAAVGLSTFCIAAILSAEKGYQFSFYQSFSRATWVGFVIAIFATKALILQAKRESWYADWRTALLLLFVIYAVFWELPHLIGLRFWAAPRGDLLHHYG